MDYVVTFFEFLGLIIDIFKSFNSAMYDALGVGWIILVVIIFGVAIITYILGIDDFEERRKMANYKNIRRINRKL